MILLIIFTVAFIIHGPAEQMALFVYAAGVILLMAQGMHIPVVRPSVLMVVIPEGVKGHDQEKSAFLQSR